MPVQEVIKWWLCTWVFSLKNCATAWARWKKIFHLANPILIEENKIMQMLKIKIMILEYLLQTLHALYLTFWSFGCKFRIKIESIFRSTRCRLKWWINFSSVQFLRPKFNMLEIQRTSILEYWKTALLFHCVLTFQSIVEKNGCRLISSTPSGPAPIRYQQ